ncbi:hydantoinase/oxoprolinase family protein [Geodermatophilus sp. TF02-6]|uniref:hydantoinase/oxoprolinase family protein n=1 Tax=Geodermatophilus sp. TF02-6 TaxID=2250575 RepID=UPI000DEA748F|nr:hydantoinase/oxoprolinase family protein [Geodermatophilus sp. TF02-6]RBY79855.1 hydantoinase/oxoprolinase family protein [Geodermatophilus sp. TF02-6]
MTTPTSASTGWVIGTDVGGTFTDLWLRSPDGDSWVCKSPTTADVVTGVVNAVHLAAATVGLGVQELCSQVTRFGHGTTVGLNALLTGRTARTGLITTAGFGDVLEIGRLRRGTAGLQGLDLGDYHLRGQVPPLVPRTSVVEVDERIDSDGAVRVPLDEASVLAAIARLIELEVEAVAVCLLWATENPAHELAVAELVEQELPSVFLSLSHEVAPSVGEYARASTTVANAALGPIAGSYLTDLERELGELGMTAPILMTTSAGGVVPARTVTQRPVSNLLSGPASCVVAGQKLGAELGTSHVLTMDVGGTSFDVGVVVDGIALMSDQVTFGGADMRVPSIDIASIGAGGGSIAAVEGGVLSVGPRSAGAEPGPVCYGKGGTEPTTTDADLVLGVLDPAQFGSGGIVLDRIAAAAAIEQRIGRPLGLSAVEAARAIRVVFDNAMADLLRAVTIERGHDPREFSLVAGGGSGPSHAWALCRETGLAGFLVPPTATAASAFGAGTSDLRTTASRTSYRRILREAGPGDEDARVLVAALAETRARALAAIPDPEGSTVTDVASIRYSGQAHHLDVALPTDVDTAAVAHLLEDFEREYEQLWGKGAGFQEAGFEILSVRSVAALPATDVAGGGSGEPFERVGTRPVVFDDADNPDATAVYQVRRPAAGQEICGPALINLPGCVVVVPPDSTATTDALGLIHVKVN